MIKLINLLVVLLLVLSLFAVEIFGQKNPVNVGGIPSCDDDVPCTADSSVPDAWVG